MQQSLSPVDLRQATLESPYNGWRALYQTRQASWLLCCPNAAPQVVSTNGERRPQNLILSISSRVMLIAGAVVEPRGLRGLVGGDGARILEGTAVGEVVGDAGGAEAVAVDGGRQPGPPDARRLTIWNTICLFIRAPLSRDFVMSTAWNRGAFDK